MKSFRTIGIITSILLILIFVLAITFAISAEDKKKTAEGKEKAFIDGKIWNTRIENGSRISDITGNVIVRYKDMVMTADKAVYFEKDKTVIVTGNVKIVNPENEITGQKGTAYLNQRLSIIEGNVKLITKPKTQPNAKKENSQIAELKSEPAEMTCDKIEYLYRKKIATAEGNIKVVQKGKRFTASKAIYDVNLELLTLPNGVNAVDEKGNTFTSKGLVKASLKEGNEWITSEYGGSASVEVDLDEEDEDNSDSSSEKASEKN